MTGDHEELVMSKMTYLGPGEGFACTDCDYRASKKGNIRCHVETRHLDLSYQCKYCDKIQKSYKAWYTHNRIHDNERI